MLAAARKRGNLVTDSQRRGRRGAPALPIGRGLALSDRSRRVGASAANRSGFGLGAPQRGLELSEALRLALLGLLETIRVALDADDLGVVHETVDERDDARGMREDGVPLGERLVRRDDD